MARDEARARWARLLTVALAAAVSCAAGARPAAAQEGGAAGGTGRTLREALEAERRRVDELEDRLERLEESLPADGDQDEEVDALEEHGLLGGPGASTGLGLHGGDIDVTLQLFADVGYRYRRPDAGTATTSSFAFGSFDIFTTGRVGERFRFLGETLIEGVDDAIELDQERLWAGWEFFDWLFLKAGLAHLPTSRWNRTFHHGKWLELTIDRPLLARFEDDGGILPKHYVGVEASGTLAGSAGTAEYVLIVSNGRGATPTDRQTVRDGNTSKAVDIALAFTPRTEADLTAGVSGRWDEAPREDGNPARSRSLGELAAGAFVSYRRDELEILAEGIVLHHEQRGGDVYTHFSAYVQAGYHWGEWTPYARFDIREMDRGDPFYSGDDLDLDLWEQLVGLRRELTEHAAVKVEVGAGRVERRRSSGAVTRNTVLTAGVQLSWYF